MFELKRRDLLLGLSGILIYGCADSEKYNDGKDYYPVSQWSDGTIYHWGTNNTINIDTDYSGSPASSLVTAFETGVNLWSDTLSEVGVTLSYSGTADVNVNWKTAAQMYTLTGSTSVLGYASTTKNIYMRSDLETTYGLGTTQSTALHEFGHMLGIWSHSFDPNDIMYPYIYVSALSNRDKKTVTDFLYASTPSLDMHDVSGPLVNPQTGSTIPYATTYYTTSGCVIDIG